MGRRFVPCQAVTDAGHWLAGRDITGTPLAGCRAVSFTPICCGVNAAQGKHGICVFQFLVFKGENWVYRVVENSRKRHWMMREVCQIPLVLITQFLAFCPLRLSAAERLIYIYIYIYT